MSAPETNLKKQEKRHKTPLFGMAAVVIFAATLLIALIAYLVIDGVDPVDDGEPGVEITEEPVAEDG